MTKKLIYKNCILSLAILLILVIAAGCGSSNASKIEVIVADFSAMSKDETRTWCDTNEIKYSFEDEYSNTITKGSFISQSVDADAVIYQGDTIKVVYSLGKEPSNEEKNALRKAEQYSSTMNMSKKGIYDQLTSEYGEGFTIAAAQYAIDNMDADWNANALRKAEQYSSTMSMSKKGIYDQLISQHGEQFTKEEAQYAIDNMEADWNANALEKAKSYQDLMSMSKKAVYDQLISRHGEQFTKEEAQYAIDHLDD